MIVDDAKVRLLKTPEGCRLKSHHTGDGWLLSVETAVGDVVAFLDWPQSWPEIVTANELKVYGFEIT